MSRGHAWTDKYPQDPRVLECFFSEIIIKQPGKVMSRTLLFHRFIKFCEERGHVLVREARAGPLFSRELHRYFPGVKRYTGGSFLGLGLRGEKELSSSPAERRRSSKYKKSPKGKAAEARYVAKDGGALSRARHQRWRARLKLRLFCDPVFAKKFRGMKAGFARESRARLKGKSAALPPPAPPAAPASREHEEGRPVSEDMAWEQHRQHVEREKEKALR